MLGSLLGAKPTETLPFRPKSEAIESTSKPKAIKDPKKLHEAQPSEPVYKGRPEDQVIVLDMDETLVAGDKDPQITKKEEKINGNGDRRLSTIKKGDPVNKLPFDVHYVLRPGAKELVEYLHARGYKIIVSTRNYRDYAQAICDNEPALKACVDGVLGREDLQSDINKDFKKYPNHPDHYGFFGRIKNSFLNIFSYGPGYLWRKTLSIFNGKNERWNPPHGKLGKYPPNMIELLKANANHALDGYKPPRILVDNKASREKRDSKESGDWIEINPNVDRGDGKETEFEADLEEPQIDLDNPETGETKPGYKWVKQVIEGIERGWQEQYKLTFNEEPKEEKSKKE